MTRAPLKLYLVAVVTDSPSNQAGTVPDGQVVGMDRVNVHCVACAEKLADVAFVRLHQTAATHDHFE